MKPLGRDARSVIEAARRHEGIRDGDRDRLRARVMARAAAAGSVIAAATVASDVAAKSTAVAALGGAAQVAGVGKLGLPKLWLALAITAGGTASVYAVHELPRDPVMVLAPAIDRDVHHIAPDVAARARAAAPAAAEVVSADDATDQGTGGATARPDVSAVRAPASGDAATTDALADEAKLLSSAQIAFGQGNVEAALDLLYQHATQFPRGKLATERRALLAIALCKSGRHDEGVRTAGRLLDRSTPLGTRIADACEGK